MIGPRAALFCLWRESPRRSAQLRSFGLCTKATYSGYRWSSTLSQSWWVQVEPKRDDLGSWWSPQVSNHTSDNPPSYEFLTAQTTNSSVSSHCIVLNPWFTPTLDEQPLPISDKGARPVRQPSTPPVSAVHNRPAPMTQQPVVYHYQNPTTGEHLASLLPPDHPEMVCLQQGGHLNETKFGILGRDKWYYFASIWLIWLFRHSSRNSMVPTWHWPLLTWPEGQVQALRYDHTGSYLWLIGYYCAGSVCILIVLPDLVLSCVFLSSRHSI